MLKGHSVARVNILEIERFVCAFDDLGSAIITPNPLDEGIIRLAGILGNEDVARAPQITRSLAQGAAREQEFVPKRRLAIHQHDVETMFEMQIL